MGWDIDFFKIHESTEKNPTTENAIQHIKGINDEGNLTVHLWLSTMVTPRTPPWTVGNHGPWSQTAIGQGIPGNSTEKIKQEEFKWDELLNVLNNLRLFQYARFFVADSTGKDRMKHLEKKNAMKKDPQSIFHCCFEAQFRLEWWSQLGLGHVHSAKTFAAWRSTSLQY